MKRKIVITIIALISLCSITFSTIAESLTEQQKKIQQQLRENKDKLKQVEDNLSEAMKELQNLNATISEYENEIQELNGNLADLEQDIKEKKEKLQESEKKQGERAEALETRTLAMLKMNDTTYLDVLLSSSDFNDLITHYYMIEKMADWDNDFIEEMKHEIEENKKIKESLEAKREEVITAKAEIEKKSTALRNAKVQKNSYVAKLNDEEKALQSDIDAFNNELSKVNVAIEQQRKKEEEERKKNNNTSSGTGSNDDYNKYTGGTLSWPTRITKRVNSVYAPGGRTDISVSGTTHKGIDLYAPHGTPIYAAAEGKVVYINYSGWGGGFGTYVVLSHGNGLYTLYAHGSGIGNISVGSTVNTNTVIMYSGNTGWSYGAHLHFEVCLGSISNKVNPAPYLGIQNKVGYVQ